MARTINTLFANINHAARTGETVRIGGGEFSPAELGEALAQFKAMRGLSDTAAHMLEDMGNGWPVKELAAPLTETVTALREQGEG